MEEKLEFENHVINVKNRETVEISGVRKIESLNEKEFILHTVLGQLSILGDGLEMVSLKLDIGELSIMGTINSIKYLEKSSHDEKKPTFLNKLFK